MKTAIKKAVFETFEWSGLNTLARSLGRNSLVVLNYHGVLDGDFRTRHRAAYINNVATEEFAGHLEFLTRHYRPVRASDVEAWVSGEGELPQRAVLLTFDDGWRNNLTHAGPLLQQYDVPAIIFLATGYIGSSRLLWTEELYELGMRWPRNEVPLPNSRGGFPLDGDRHARSLALVSFAKKMPTNVLASWLEGLRMEVALPAALSSDGVYSLLTWDEVRQLPKYGFEIGSHTVNHWIVTRCTPDTLRRELEDSKSEIERQLGSACNSFCYPNGGPSDWSMETAEAVKAAGYRAAYALPDRIQRRAPLNAYAIDRVAVPGGVPQADFGARVSGTIGFLRAVLRRESDAV